MAEPRPTRGRRFDGVIRVPPGLLAASILLHLWDSGTHGYELARRMKDVGVKDDPSAMYARLRDLEAAKLVESSIEVEGAGPRRKRYKLTASGRETLRRSVQSVLALDGLLRDFLDHYARLDAMEAGGRTEEQQG